MRGARPVLAKGGQERGADAVSTSSNPASVGLSSQDLLHRRRFELSGLTSLQRRWTRKHVEKHPRDVSWPGATRFLVLFLPSFLSSFPGCSHGFYGGLSISCWPLNTVETQKGREAAARTAEW